MAHIRKRHLQANYEKIAKFSPIVGLFGHRQVGKTTFTELYANDYVSFDDLDRLKEAQLDPKKFIQNHHKKGTAIDECQMVPEIFPILKERVRTNKAPGQFLLTGSVRFSSRLAIRESLTGRIVTLELLPLTLSELTERSLPQLGNRLLACNSLLPVIDDLKQLEKKNKALSHWIDLYLTRGGLPGLCFMREERHIRQKVDAQLQTILDRDIRLIYPSTLPFSQIFEFVRTLALREGEIWHPTEIRRLTRISEVTQKKLIQALEAIFMLRLIPCEGGRGGYSIWFEDQLELDQLVSTKLAPEQKWRSLVFRNFREQFEYRLGLNYRVFQYRTRGGAKVPFAYQVEDKVLGLIPIQEDSPQRSELFSAQSFLKTYMNSKVIFVSKTSGLKELGPRMAVIPATILLFE